MDDVKISTNKTLIRRNIDQNSRKQYRHPIKRCHSLDGKRFVVIDESITEKLGFTNLPDIFFQQEITDDDCIVLRCVKLGEKKNNVDTKVD